MNKKRFFIIFLNISLLIGQSSVFETEPGFIYVKADSSSLPIYLDGNLIGHTPIEKPIPVIEGVHFIGFHPPSFKDPFLSYGKVESDKQIFVLSGDTVNVSFNTFLVDNNIKKIKKEYQMTNYVGIGMLGLFLYQLWIISG